MAKKEEVDKKIEKGLGSKRRAGEERKRVAVRKKATQPREVPLKPADPDDVADAREDGGLGHGDKEGDDGDYDQDGFTELMMLMAARLT